MNRLMKWMFANRSVEEIIFSMLLIAGIPYFIINEIIDLVTNRSLTVFLINTSIISYTVYLLRQSLKRTLKKYHIFIYSLMLAIGFVAFWPSSSGLSGPGAYVFQSLIVVLLLVNSRKSTWFFALYLLAMLGVTGFLPIEYSGKIIYSSQMTSFLLNSLVIALAMNIFKIALDRERKKLVNRIKKLNAVNEQVETRNRKLVENQKEIRRIQSHLQEIINERTKEIEKENDRLVEYSFINAHLVRAPLANMIGLSEILVSESEEQKYRDLHNKIKKVDTVVRKIGGVLTLK